MPRKIQDTLDNKHKGFVRLNSIYLPFHFELISVWVGKEMSLLDVPEQIADFAPGSEVAIREGEHYTNIILRKHKNLRREYGHYRGHVVLCCAEKGSDIFNPDNRYFLKLSFRDDSDEVTIEKVTDPFKL